MNVKNAKFLVPKRWNLYIFRRLAYAYTEVGSDLTNWLPT